MRRLVWGLAIGAALCCCTSLEQGARQEFSSEFTCPEGSITVTQRDDLDADEIQWGPPPPPPPEVAKDPERAALWKKQHANTPSGHIVFQAQGCQHEAFYSCGRSNKGRPMCSALNYHSRPKSWGTCAATPAATASGAHAPMQAVVQANFEPFRRCFRDRNPALYGHVTLSVEVAASGHVNKAALSHTAGDLADPGLGACLAGAFSALSFPPSDAGSVTVLFPVTCDQPD
jgi:hypothetical protein